uniref:3'(2'),5'-bisphosphate nucleotidase CysQ n=1 Tax=Stappia sp. TaxID=1870903 RepID=UPI003BAB63E5
MAPTRDMECLRGMCEAAGRVILDLYEAGVEVERKSDESPVTEADRRAEAVLLEALATAYPGVPVVAEEAAAAGRIPEIGDRFFLVDPLDGTREFVSGRGEFTVNVALVEHGVPVLGAVYAPATGGMFVGATDAGAFELAGGGWKRCQVRMPAHEPPVALASRSHADAQTEELLGALGVRERVSVGSSLKFCLLARGEADFYPRFGRTMEWDTAAGHAVLTAAGGVVTGIEGTPFRYGKRNQAHDTDFANPGFLAAGDPALIRGASTQVEGVKAL